MRPRILVTALAAAALTACGAYVTAPGTNLSGLPEGLHVGLTVAPDTVAQGGAFDATLTVTNRTAGTIRVTTAHGCLATPHVMREGRRVPFEGSGYGCTAAITTHTFAPGESRSQRWEMRAELYAEHPGDVDGQQAPSGDYLVRMEFDLRGPDGTKPFIERSLLVR